MRKFLVSAVLILSVFVSIQAQKSGMANYQVVPKDLSNVLNQNDGETNAIVKQTLNIAKDFDFVLYFDKDESLYYREEQLNTGNGAELGQKLAKALTDTGTYYQNKEQGVNVRSFFGLGKDYRIENTLLSDFTLTKERKKIGEFECVKAILSCTSCGGKEEIVWFAPSIPVPFGPEGYGGLPGLIVEVEKRTFTLRLSKLKFKTISKTKMKRPIKGELITEEDYRKLSKEARNKLRYGK